MKGYGPPSWFRMKGFLQKGKAKAQQNDQRTHKPKKAERR